MIGFEAISVWYCPAIDKIILFKIRDRNVFPCDFELKKRGTRYYWHASPGPWGCDEFLGEL